MVAEGGLGEDISELPVAGAAPEWMSEKAVSIGMYFVASGVYTVIAEPLPILGAANLTRYLTADIEKDVGGKWAFERDPVKARSASCTIWKNAGRLRSENELQRRLDNVTNYSVGGNQRRLQDC